MVTKINAIQVKHETGNVKDVLDTVKPLTNYDELRSYNGFATQIRITDPGISGFFYLDGTVSSTSEDNGGTIIVGTTDSDTGTAGNQFKRWKRHFDGPVNVMWFGAKGDGVTDDTNAITASFLPGRNVVLPSGTYLISSSTQRIIPNQGYQKFYGDGDVTIKVSLADSTDSFMFNGPVSIDNLKIDFNEGPSRYLFRWTANAGHIVINNIRFKNLRDTNNTTGTINLWIVETGNTFAVSNIKAYSMLKKGNGVITDSAGSYNLLYIGGGTGSTNGQISNFTVSEIHNIDSSGSVIYEDTAVIYIATDSSDTSNAVDINNITGTNFGKRLIKTHASNVSINSVIAFSDTGDTLGAVGFLSGQGLGDKYGCSATNCRAIGLMEAAFAGTAIGIRWNNITASVQSGTKPGMSNGAVGIMILSDNTTVDGYYSDSQRDIGIGSNLQVIKNTTIKNVTLVLNNTKAVFSSIYNLSNTIGFDGLLIDGVYCYVSGDATNTSCIYLSDYLNATVKGKNLTIKNVTQISSGPVNSYFISAKYVDNVSIGSLKYTNNSANSHFRLVTAENCSNVNVSDVNISGTNAIGVYVKDCSGRNTVSTVYNPGSSIAVYNSNSTNVLVSGCDHAKVLGVAPDTPQYIKQTSGITSSRPTTDLIIGYSQHFDTTLGKQIWWNGTVWKDATGTTV